MQQGDRETTLVALCVTAKTVDISFLVWLVTLTSPVFQIFNVIRWNRSRNTTIIIYCNFSREMLACPCVKRDDVFHFNIASSEIFKGNLAKILTKSFLFILLRGLLIAYAIFTVRHVLRGENHAFQKEVTIYHYCIIEQMNSMVGGTKSQQQHVICSYFFLSQWRRKLIGIRRGNGSL